MNPSIKRPTREDIAPIHTLFERTVHDVFMREGIAVSHSNDISVEIEGLKQTLQRDFDSRGRDEFFLIAKVHSTPVGTIAAGPANDILRKHLRSGKSPPPGIKAAYVLPEYQGKGIGTLLFKAILRQQFDAGAREFCLDCGYTVSQKFWTRRIGPPTVKLENYWGPGAPHMIWCLSIADTLQALE